MAITSTIQKTEDGYESTVTIELKKKFTCLECAKRETAEVVMDFAVL